MLVLQGSLLLRRWLGLEAVRSTVVADVGHGDIIDHGLAVDVGDLDRTEARDGGVVDENAVPPVAAVVADPGIAEAIVDAAVEADPRPPISSAPHIDTVVPGPIARGPQQTWSRRPHPGAGNPKVAELAPCPVAGYPDEVRTRDHRLHIDRQRWRRRRNADQHLGTRGRGEQGQGTKNNEDSTGGSHGNVPRVGPAPASGAKQPRTLICLSPPSRLCQPFYLNGK